MWSVIAYYSASSLVLSGFLTPIYWHKFVLSLNFAYGIVGFFISITAANFIHALFIDLVLDPRIKRGKFLDTLLSCLGISGTFCLLLTVLWGLLLNFSLAGYIAIGIAVIFIWWFMFIESSVVKGIYGAPIVVTFSLEVVLRILSMVVAILIISILTGTANRIKSYLI